MPWLTCKSGKIHYELTGPEHGPACVLVNGLTQYIKLWHPFRDGLVARGFQVASYDMLGQGQSDKPRLFIEQEDQVDVLRELIASLGPRPTPSSTPTPLRAWCQCRALPRSRRN
jgi:3-oxoadipate enol-lactonase